MPSVRHVKSVQQSTEQRVDKTEHDIMKIDILLKDITTRLHSFDVAKKGEMLPKKGHSLKVLAEATSDKEVLNIVQVDAHTTKALSIKDPEEAEKLLAEGFGEELDPEAQRKRLKGVKRAGPDILKKQPRRKRTKETAHKPPKISIINSGKFRGMAL
ncbi:hypothetical protein ACS0TY_013040 [Phlomoides rotata]